MPLNVKKIARLRQSGRYGDGNGLYLEVKPSGARSWVFRYTWQRKERWMGLGPLHTWNLDEARERARKARQQLSEDKDPIGAKRAARAAQALEEAKSITFEEAARNFFEQNEGRWKNAKHAQQFLSTLQMYAFRKIGALPVAEIDTGLVLKVLEPIWHTKTETARRLRARIERVLTWATVRGYRQGENPARWTGHLREALPSRSEIAPVQHHAALPFKELPEFIAKLRTRPAIAAKALEFCILTASRTGEIIGARWGEIDLENKLWIVPAERMKAGREHRVPLSDRAVKILEALPREAAFVFPGGKKNEPMSNMAMAVLLKRMKISPDKAVVHGFRSTFRDWTAEQTNYPNHVAEAALAHIVGDKVEAAYRRGDLFEKRAELMADWSKYLEAPNVSAKP